MKLCCKFKVPIQKFIFLGIFCIFLILQSCPKLVYSLPMEKYHSRIITEELRLKVPAEIKDAWLSAEKKVWDPWLSNQDGYLGRQLFWDKEKEEALILVNWKNRALWKSISEKEVVELQKKFEENVKENLKINTNPFKLIYEGELVKQG